MTNIACNGLGSRKRLEFVSGARNHYKYTARALGALEVLCRVVVQSPFDYTRVF